MKAGRRARKQGEVWSGLLDDISAGQGLTAALGLDHQVAVVIDSDESTRNQVARRCLKRDVLTLRMDQMTPPVFDRLQRTLQSFGEKLQKSRHESHDLI